MWTGPATLLGLDPCPKFGGVSREVAAAGSEVRFSLATLLIPPPGRVSRGGGGPVSGERRFESLISDSWISSAEAGWRGCGWRNQAGGSWDGVGKGFASVAQFGTMRLALEDCCSLLPGISSVDWHRNLLSFCSLTASCHYLKPRWSFMFVRYRANALRTYLRLMFCLISVFSSDFANIFNLFFVSFCVCQYHGRIRVILKTVLPK